MKSLVLACVLAGVASCAVAQPKTRIGVFLPLTGPRALEGAEAKKVLERIRKDGVEVVLVDSESNPARAGEIVRRLAQQEKVKVIIGGTTLREVEEMITAAPGVPVLTLTAVASEAMARRARDAQVFTFTQSRQQIQAIAAALPKNSKFVQASAPSYLSSSDALLAAAGVQPITRTEITPMLEADKLLGIGKQATQQSAVLTGVMDAAAAERMLGALRRASGKGVILSPPQSAEMAEIVAKVVTEVARRSSMEPTALRSGVQSSPYYNTEAGSLQVYFPVSSLNVQFNPAGSTTGGKACKCTSKDGRYSNSTTCSEHQECEVRQEEDTCTCKCK